MRLSLAALALAAVLPLAALAQTAAPATISVSGDGSVQVAPDIAIVTLGVTTDGATAAEALAANSESQAKVIEALKAAGVETRDIQTSNLSINPNWVSGRDTSEPPKIAGYQASNQVTVQVRDLDRLGEVLDQVVNTGANTLNSLSFGLADDRAQRDEARKRAVADAMARARLYAEAAGVTLGPLVSLTEGGSPAPQPMFRRAAMAEAAVPVESGELSVDASVSLVFSITK